MSESGNEAAAKAALAAGKRAAKRAVDDLLLSDEEKAKRSAEEEAAAKRRRWKYIAYGVIGLALVIGVIGILLTYWYWFLLAGIVGAGGFLAWMNFKSKRGERADGEAPRAAKAPANEEVERPKVKSRVAAPDPRAQQEAARKAEADRRAAFEAEAKAMKEARAQQEAEVDEELARMKERLKRR